MPELFRPPTVRKAVKKKQRVVEIELADPEDDLGTEERKEGEVYEEY
jgi:hypothetical protein